MRYSERQHRLSRLDKLLEYSISPLRSYTILRPQGLRLEAIFYTSFNHFNWGRGFEKIHNAFTAENLKLPTFATHTGGFEVDILREKYVVMSGYDKIMDKSGTKNVTDDTVNETNQGASVQDSDTNETNHETNLRQLILATVSSRPDISVTDLSLICKVSRATLYRTLSQMKDEVKRTGSTRKGHWEIVKK